MRRNALKKIISATRKNWSMEKKKEWQKNAEFWIKIIRKGLDPYRLKVTNKAILELLKGDKQLRILDAGCGEGYLARTLAKLGHKVWAIDFCPGLIKAAERLEKKELLGVKYFLEDFRKTHFLNSSFDVVFSHQTINEVGNPKKALREFYRILKKRGRVILLFLHPCFEVDPKFYFHNLKIKKPYYLVSGIKSPSSYFYLHLPLSKWIKLLNETEFLIKSIAEPRPPLTLIQRDRWWKENFKKPLFILIEAIKV